MRPWLLALALCGCANGTYVVVVIDAQPGVEATATSLRVSVASGDGTVRRDETLTLAEAPLPVRVPLSPLGGDASRGWIVEATLLDGAGAVLSVGRARGGYEAGLVREAGLCLYEGCAAASCGCSGTCETCRAGRCGDADVLLGPPGSAPRCPDTCAPVETACSDRIDDDCDGALDCADPDCACPDAGPPDAGTDTPGLDVPGLDAGCASSESSVGGCANGLDDDCDGVSDCADPDCGCFDAGCPGVQPENTVALCHDGLDNDCDGVRDCGEGPDCRIPEGPAGCRNGLDDDCDGMIDCVELDCAQEACGPAGERCCAGACVDTYSDEAHCGGCGMSCDPSRVCVRVPDGSGGLAGAACRCGTSAECPRGGLCETHDSATLCNCVDDTDCGGGTTCRRQGAMHHSYCGY